MNKKGKWVEDAVTEQHYFVDAKTLAVQAAQDMAMIKDAAEQKGRRLAATKEWSTPENVERNRLQHEALAAAALEMGRRSKKDEDLPVPDPLPKHMVGQSASTIQRMLRNGWKPDEAPATTTWITPQVQHYKIKEITKAPPTKESLLDKFRGWWND